MSYFLLLVLRVPGDVKKKKQKREKEKERLTTEKGKKNSTTELLKLKKTNKAPLPQRLRAAELLYLLWQCFLVWFHPGLLVAASVRVLLQVPQPALLCQTTNTSSYNQ